MGTAEIRLEPFGRAIQRLEEGLAALSKEPDNLLLRDGVLQRYEFTYELSHKMLRRFLESVAANPQEITNLSFQDLIRVGGEQDLLRSPWRQWRSYRQARTDTSHTYNEASAVEVLKLLPDFVLETRYLLERMEASLDRE